MKYYSTQRPIGPGSCPMENIVEIKNFDTRKFCADIGRTAWGYIVYSKPLSERDAKDYELLCYQNPLTERKCERFMRIILKAKADRVQEISGNEYYRFSMPKDQLDLTRFDLERLSESSDPEADLAEMMSDLETSYNRDWLYGHLADDVIRKELQKKFTSDQIEDRMEFIDEFVEEYCMAEYPSFDEEEIQAVIAMDTGDAKDNFETNTRDNFWRENSIKWLAKQQGCYDEIKAAIEGKVNQYDDDMGMSEFVRSTLSEMDEYNSGGMLCFLVTMSLKDYIKLKNLIRSEKEMNHSERFENRTGESTFTVSKDAPCGLYYPNDGYGSLLEIQLAKNVQIPTKAVFDVWIDIGKQYPLGCNGRGCQISYSYCYAPNVFSGSVTFDK